MKPKYAYSILTGGVKIECERVLREVARKHGFELFALEVMPDHVHVFVGFKPSVPVSRVLMLFKGSSSRILFQRFPRLRKTYWGGHLWSPGKFFRSVGAATDAAVKHYIEQSQHDWQYATRQTESDPQQTQITQYN